MRVKLATQIFSRTVAAGIRTMSDFDKFSTDAKPFVSATANFIEKVDWLFDNLNSKVIFDPNPYKSALKVDNRVNQNLDAMLGYFSQVKTTNKTSVYCINGIIQTISGILFLFEYLKTNNSGIDFILTARLNQDPIENLFGLVRQRGGNSANSSLFEFNHTVAKIMAMKFLENSELTNCEMDADEMLIPNTLVDDYNQNYDDILKNSVNNIPQSHIISENEDLEVIMVEADSNYEEEFDDSSLRYFIGFIAFKHLKKANCATCKTTLIKSEDILEAKSERFIIYKNYSNNTNFGSLHAPSDTFFKISKLHIDIFTTIFKLQPHMENIKSYIRDACVTQTVKKEEFGLWFNENNPCYQHNLALLDYILLILLRKHSKWVTKKFIGANKSARNKDSNKKNTTKI